jgi:dihydrofolate reductase
MRLTVTTFQTIDGVMQAPGGPDEDRDGGFPHGGWLVPHFDEHTGAFMDETFRRASAFLLGRRTYDVFAAHWPHVEDQDEPVARGLNTLPRHVASRTRTGDLEWAGASVLGADDVLVERIRELKADGDGELQVHGSAGLLQTLFAHELVDVLRLLTFPVVLGTGKRVFAGGAAPAALRLAESRTTPNGVTIAVYEHVGRPDYGSYALDQEPSAG